MYLNGWRLKKRRRKNPIPAASPPSPTPLPKKIRVEGENVDREPNESSDNESFNQ